MRKLASIQRVNRLGVVNDVFLCRFDVRLDVLLCHFPLPLSLVCDCIIAQSRRVVNRFFQKNFQIT